VRLSGFRSALAPVVPEAITIAVTVFDRPDYVAGAVRSALRQNTAGEGARGAGCRWDARVRPALEGEFGQRISFIAILYDAGSSGRGNLCIESCQTPWLSILHDDDLLEPSFVASMNRAAGQAPSCALYFGGTTLSTKAGAGLLRSQGRNAS